MNRLDPYVYSDVPVLRNKLGIKDKDELIEIESQILIAKLIDIDSLVHNVDFFHVSSIRKIHKHLFEDIYEWAGDFRTINIFKEEKVLNGLSVEYSSKNQIEGDLRRVLSSASRVTWTHDNTDLVHDFSRFMAGLWKVHPYREGNTRTISLYMKLFADSQGLEFDDQLLSHNAGYLRNALVMASIGTYAEPHYLQNIIRDALTSNGAIGMERVEDESHDYSHIGEYNVNDYEEIPFTVYEEETSSDKYEDLDELVEEAKERTANRTHHDQKAQKKSVGMELDDLD